MCKDCAHWKRHEEYETCGLRFAPCSLKPDSVVRDSRAPSGFVEQVYVTQSTYECSRFVETVTT